MKHHPEHVKRAPRRWSAATAALASAGAALVLSAGALVALSAPSSAQPTSLVACTFPAWGEGGNYTSGTKVTYKDHGYQAIVAHTAYPGANWNPASTPTLWRDLGACDDSTPTDPPTDPTDPPTDPTDPPTDPPGGGEPTCAVKGKPAGKVLQGYWENWDGASNGVHPPFGWSPIDNPVFKQHGYNVYNAAFPVIRGDGTVLWEDGMDATVKVATPEQMCAAKAAGATILMSIGGATAGIDLGSRSVADKFIQTIVPILKKYNFDGIDIDIETGLTGAGSPAQLSTSQENLIHIIDGVLAAMPSNFGLTMAPETAYVTGGSVTYGSIWGAYLPIVKKYADNGRLWWLNMQYYNGSMYGCHGDSYSAATVEGFVKQTQCLNDGLVVGGVTIKVPFDKQAPGLPAQPGAGGGYMTPGLVSQAWNSFNGQLKGLMTWSMNWDGSKSWSFGDNVARLQGR